MPVGASVDDERRVSAMIKTSSLTKTNKEKETSRRRREPRHRHRNFKSMDARLVSAIDAKHALVYTASLSPVLVLAGEWEKSPFSARSVRQLPFTDAELFSRAVFDLDAKALEPYAEDPTVLVHIRDGELSDGVLHRVPRELVDRAAKLDYVCLYLTDSGDPVLPMSGQKLFRVACAMKRDQEAAAARATATTTAAAATAAAAPTASMSTSKLSVKLGVAPAPKGPAHARGPADDAVRKLGLRGARTELGVETLCESCTSRIVAIRPSDVSRDTATVADSVEFSLSGVGDVVRSFVLRVDLDGDYIYRPFTRATLKVGGGRFSDGVFDSVDYNANMALARAALDSQLLIVNRSKEARAALAPTQLLAVSSRSEGTASRWRAAIPLMLAPTAHPSSDWLPLSSLRWYEARLVLEGVPRQLVDVMSLEVETVDLEGADRAWLASFAGPKDLEGSLVVTAASMPTPALHRVWHMHSQVRERGQCKRILLESFTFPTHALVIGYERLDGMPEMPPMALTRVSLSLDGDVVASSTKDELLVDNWIRAGAAIPGRGAMLMPLSSSAHALDGLGSAYTFAHVDKAELVFELDEDGWDTTVVVTALQLNVACFSQGAAGLEFAR